MMECLTTTLEDPCSTEVLGWVYRTVVFVARGTSHKTNTFKPSRNYWSTEAPQYEATRSALPPPPEKRPKGQERGGMSLGRASTSGRITSRGGERSEDTCAPRVPQRGRRRQPRHVPGSRSGSAAAHRHVLRLAPTAPAAGRQARKRDPPRWRAARGEPRSGNRAALRALPVPAARLQPGSSSLAPAVREVSPRQTRSRRQARPRGKEAAARPARRTAGTLRSRRRPPLT